MPTLSEIRDKLIGFAYLPIGWNFNEGVPAKEDALKTALVLLDTLEEAGFHYTDAYPGIDGSVLLTAYALPDYYDFDIKPNGLITVAHVREDEDLFYQEKMRIEDVYNKIKEFAAKKWPTFAYLISAVTTAKNSSVLRATPSKTPQTAQASPSLTSTAPGVPPVVFVNIAQGSTLPQQVRRSFSGKSRKKSFQTNGT